MAILSADKIIFPLCCIQVIFLALTCDAISEGFDAQPRVPTVTPKLQERYTPARNYPGMADFPSQVEFKKLAATLQGDVVTPVSEYYKYLAVMYNVRTTRFPYAIYLVESVEDVQKVMLFAKKHNLMVTIQSSGHSYIGRSTYDGSVQINFKKMKGRQINLQSTRSEAGEITVESGNTWLEVYTEVDKVVTATNGTQRQRVIVGGSAHTVAMGGYTQGGGHSPVCRSLGMAVDNLLEATLVTAEGKIVTVSEEGSVIKVKGTTHCRGFGVQTTNCILKNTPTVIRPVVIGYLSHVRPEQSLCGSKMSANNVMSYSISRGLYRGARKGSSCLEAVASSLIGKRGGGDKIPPLATLKKKFSR